MKTIRILLILCVFLSNSLWACPKGMTSDENGSILSKIQQITASAAVLENARELSQVFGKYSCVDYDVSNRCYQNRSESISYWPKTPEVILAFGTMMGSSQTLLSKDHEGFNHFYFAFNNRIIVETSGILDGATQANSLVASLLASGETVSHYLDCNLTSK